MELEDRFELDIPINLVSDLTTVADLVALVDRQLQTRGRADGHLRQVRVVREPPRAAAAGSAPIRSRCAWTSCIRRRRPTSAAAGRSSPAPTTIWASPTIRTASPRPRPPWRATAPARRARASPTAPTGCTRTSRPSSRAFLDRRSCMVFSTGYQANLAMIAGLAGARDVVLIDADSHASIYDACKLAGATIVRFRHNDAADLDRRLTRLGSEGECKLVIVEGMYSMLGDTAPLPEFVEVKKKHGAWLLVDEAHSFGVLRRARPGRGRAAGRRARRGFRRRHLQQEPGCDRWLRCLRPSAVRSAAPVRPTLHVHRLA